MLIRWLRRLARKRQLYKLSDEDLLDIMDSLDDTGGFLIKESELVYWIERLVNEDRKRRC